MLCVINFVKLDVICASAGRDQEKLNGSLSLPGRVNWCL